ncbi:MAG: DegV family EDD domain-containing protein [Lachnospiraceae bacterium]|nr:DegV family EDD domain-containing protein [Lachnospiraceae bacterium]
MKFDKTVQSLISDSSRSFRERVFLVLTLSATGVAIIALLGDILCGENIVEIIILALTVIMVPLSTWLGVKTGAIELTTRLISMGLIFIILPGIFFFGGGAEGGVVPWMVFSYLYIGLVMSGGWRLFSLLTLTATVAGLFVLGYNHPEWIHEHSRGFFYVDMALAVVEVGYVCFVMTWFQSRLYEQENKMAREETKKVEDMNRSQNRFFSSMSHEIRTPINSILGLNEIILRQEDASEEIRRDAGNIQGAGRMLLSLINDILDFSKIEAGRMEIVPVNYNIGSLVSEIVNMIWLRAEQKGLELKVEIDPSIPAELYGDEVRIKQILVNLLNNAVKYTRDGSVTLHIEKEDLQDDQLVLLFFVSDTGMGIKQDAIPYLFDAFQRVDEENNARIEGTGLGLSIVRQLVELMGGRITVNSVYTQGSTFMVTLRQRVTGFEAVGDIRLSSGKTEEASHYETGFTAPDARLLIVDDNEMNLEVEKKLLAATEMTIDLARSGEEALSKTLSTHYDMILMDHLMPEMDGIECLQNIRKQPGGLNNRVPIIVLTANAGSENRELYARSGFEDYLVKPVSGRQLEEMILAHMPESRVFLSGGGKANRLQMNTARGYSRRMPVVVATSSLCDLPRRVLKEYGIDTIPFVIRSEDRVFLDGEEAETGELVRYMQKGVQFSSAPPALADYEAFFAKELKKAHNVIYISMASRVSEDYAMAVAAAKAYDNVHILDSASNSSGMGILVLLAQRISARGESAEKILEELERVKSRLHCCFVADGAFVVRRRDRLGRWISNIMRTLGIWPLIRYKNGHYMVGRLSIGDSERSYMSFVDYALPASADPDPDVIFVVYSDLTEAQLKRIRERIEKRFRFKNVIIQKSSAVLALNCGSGAFGLMYIDKGEYPYHLDNMLSEEEPREAAVEEDTAQEAAVVTGPAAVPEPVKEPEEEESAAPDTSAAEESGEPAWYQKLEGIDGDTALKYNGSEEIYRMVLKIFYDSIENTSGEIEGYVDQEDWKNYTIKVHALKSSARLIGAGELSEKALKLEMAGKEGNIDFIRDNNAALLEHLRSYHPVLAPVFEGEAEKAEAEEEKAEGSQDEAERAESVNRGFDKLVLESIYEVLADAAKDADRELLAETFTEAEEYELPDEDRKLLIRLKQYFEAEEYEKMLALIEERGK